MTNSINAVALAYLEMLQPVEEGRYNRPPRDDSRDHLEEPESSKRADRDEINREKTAGEDRFGSRGPATRTWRPKPKKVKEETEITELKLRTAAKVYRRRLDYETDAAGKGEDTTANIYPKSLSHRAHLIKKHGRKAVKGIETRHGINLDYKGD